MSTQLPQRHEIGLPATTAKPGIPAKGGFSSQQRDYLLLTLFVLAKNGYGEKARVLAQALYASGDRSAACLWACATLSFECGDYEAVIGLLEAYQTQRLKEQDLSPFNAVLAKKIAARERLAFYLEARSYREIGRPDMVAQTLKNRGL